MNCEFLTRSAGMKRRRVRGKTEDADMRKKQDEQEQQDGQRTDRGNYEWMQALVCSVLAVVLAFTFVIRLIGVSGHSMVPTLQDGDRLLVVNSILYRDYHYGDIVILRTPTTAGITVWVRWIPGISSARRCFCCIPARIRIRKNGISAGSEPSAAQTAAR